MIRPGLSPDGARAEFCLPTCNAQLNSKGAEQIVRLCTLVNQSLSHYAEIKQQGAHDLEVLVG